MEMIDFISEEKPGFLGEILSAGELFELNSIQESISQLSKSISKLKEEVTEYIIDVYISFKRFSEENVQIYKRATTLSNQMDAISSKIETMTKKHLYDSTSEMKDLSAAHQEAVLSIQIVSELISIDKTIKSVNFEKANGQYLKAAMHLKDLENLLEKQRDYDLDIFKELAEEQSTMNALFLGHLSDLWMSSFQLKETKNENETTVMSISVNISQLHEIENMMQALHYCDLLDFKIRKFGSKIISLIFKPVVLYECCVDTISYELKADLEVKPDILSVNVSYLSVLQNLRRVFQFFNQFLNVKIDGNLTFLNKLGELLAEEFSDLLIKNCLSMTIPSNSSDLAAYSKVIQHVKEFRQFLIEVGFLSEDNNSILEYTQNVDVLFANKICQLHLERARNIMKKDLHDMCKISPQEETEATLYKSEDGLQNSFLILKPQALLSDKTLQFPACCISKSVNELLDLIYSILEEAMTSSDFCAVRLFYTARNIIELYLAVVPQYHKQFLETIPQQAALFHNNCMYLAHKIMFLGFEYKNRLPEILKGHSVQFLDEVQKLRTLGTNTFLAQMRVQKQQILVILKNSGLSTLGENSSVPLNTEKSIRQCLRQLLMLQTVWQSVLPENVYVKAIGCILNAFIEELIIRIVTLEDIPAEVAVRLTSLFNLVLERAPQLFQEPKDVQRYVKLWRKFQELVIVLGARLKEIEDRWASGKGPLAVEFSSEDVKRLIRALFQNTERRSAVLANIY